jgi:hypothetical protein
VGDALASGALRIVLPEYRGASDVAIYAICAMRRTGFRPAKAFIDFLTELYGPHPYWDRNIGGAGSENEPG